MVGAEGLRVLFFGTPQFAVPTLNRLLSSRHRVIGVITQPDRPRGRGQKIEDTPVKSRAMQTAARLFQPATLKDSTFLSALTELDADIGVVAAYGRILSEAIISVPRRGMINVHASLLPRYRGAAPVHRAVIAGERETGVTIMRLTKTLDAGPTLAMRRRPIDVNETSDAVDRDLAEIGASLLISTLDRMTEGGVEETPQNEAEATYAPRLTKEDGAIDWSRSAPDIHNLVRGLHPWPHAFSYLNGQRLILLRSLPEAEAGGEPGTVLTAQGDDLSVATGKGVVRLLELQAEGKRAMSTRDFLAGHPIALGDRFSSRP